MTAVRPAGGAGSAIAVVSKDIGYGPYGGGGGDSWSDNEEIDGEERAGGISAPRCGSWRASHQSDGKAVGVCESIGLYAAWLYNGAVAIVRRERNSGGTSS